MPYLPIKGLVLTDTEIPIKGGSILVAFTICGWLGSQIVSVTFIGVTPLTQTISPAYALSNYICPTPIFLIIFVIDP